MREFVDAAMNTARDLARADAGGGPASAAEIRRADGEDHALAHPLRRHHRDHSGLGPALLGVEAGKVTAGENTVRLIFEAP